MVFGYRLYLLLIELWFSFVWVGLGLCRFGVLVGLCLFVYDLLDGFGDVISDVFVVLEL